MRPLRMAVALSLLAVTIAGRAYAAQPTLLDMRNKIMVESAQVKDLLRTSKDVYLISSLWDSCLLSMSQLDAYFSMVGIFNTIPKDQAARDAVSYLEQWLREIRRTNELNIKSLSTIKDTIDPSTKIHMDAVKNIFTQLNNQLDMERNKLILFKKTLKR